MRGLFTAGVIDVFLENGIEVDAAVGVSAGAAFGCNYKSKQNGRVLRYNKKYCNDKRYCSIRSLIRTGDLYGREFCYYTLPRELDPFDNDTYDNSPMDFYVVCTDVLTGKPVYQLVNQVDDDCFEWMRASASMPMVSRPVKVGGYLLLDGGMSDSIPLRFMTDKGYEKNIVVLTRPRSYVKSPASILPLKLFLRKYPAMIGTMKNRHVMYQFEREFVFKEEAEGRAFVICPGDSLPIGRIEHDPDRIQATYDIGRAVAEARLSALKEFLNN